jgi:hypothetical protein
MVTKFFLRACIASLKSENRTIWVAVAEATPTSNSLHDISLVVPEKLAIVIGRDGKCGQVFAEAADALVHLPAFGFTKSLTTSIFSALVLYVKALKKRVSLLQAKIIFVVPRSAGKPYRRRKESYPNHLVFAISDDKKKARAI